MTGSDAYVVAETDVPETREPGDTATVRATIDTASGSDRLEQRVIRFAPGRSQPRSDEGRDEVLYVAAGRGTLLLEGERYALDPDTGLYVRAGERYEIDNPGPEDLLLVSVRAPAEAPDDGRPRRVAVRYAEQEPLPASPNREFRYLVNEDAGCTDVTQFVGVIPPGRAPMHSHTYDEVIYVVEGEGILHVGGRSHAIAAGSCIHLPPLLMHCLENAGSSVMRVLGVFHPAGDPASRAGESA